MILAVDIGNTHMEIGLYHQNQFIDSWRITSSVSRTEDELMVYTHQFLSFSGVQPKQIRDFAIASVVPSTTQILKRMCEKYFKINPLVVTPALDFGIDIDYNPPSSVGADRICNAVATFRKYGGPAIVVDVGTATTFDVISKGGVYLGGAIAPGLETAAFGLSSRTSKLPTISFEFPKSTIGKATYQSMQSGIMFGTVALIDGICERIAKELQDQPVVIATGGQSSILAPYSKHIQHVEPRLVLEGLMLIYHRNVGGR
jgi:type III pantothenate kinase